MATHSRVYCCTQISDHPQRLRTDQNTLAAHADGHSWPHACRRRCSTMATHGSTSATAEEEGEAEQGAFQYNWEARGTAPSLHRGQRRAGRGQPRDPPEVCARTTPGRYQVRSDRWNSRWLQYHFKYHFPIPLQNNQVLGAIPVSYREMWNTVAGRSYQIASQMPDPRSF